jgi:antitoxin CptB
MSEHGYIRETMPAPHADSPLDIRRKRLLFRSWHRGTREADLILGSFAEAHLAGFDEPELDRFEALLEIPDAELFDWINGRAAPPPGYDHEVTRRLLAFRYRPRAT